MTRKENKTILIIDYSRGNGEKIEKRISSNVYKIRSVNTTIDLFKSVNSKINIDLIIIGIDPAKFNNAVNIAEKILGIRKTALLFLTPELSEKITNSVRDISPISLLIKDSDDCILNSYIDISIQVFNSQKLQTENQEIFRDLYENAPNAYFSISKDGKIKRCNNRAANLLEFSMDELIGKPVLHLYADTPSGKDKARRIFKHFKAGIPIQNEELQMISSTGRIIWISLTVNSSKNERDEIVESRSIVVDITDRKRIEAELEKSEKHFKSIFDTMYNGFALLKIIYDKKDNPIDYIFLEINPSFEKLTRLKGKKIIGKTVSKVIPGFNSQWSERYNEVARTGKSIQFEEYSKSIKKFFIVTAYCPKEGEIAVIFDDISNRKRAEKRMQLLVEMVEQSTESIIYTDTDFNITYINKATTKLYGWKLKELEGKTPDIFDYKLQSKEVEKKIIKTVTSGKPYFGESLNKRKDESSFYCQYKISPLTNKDGIIIGYMRSQRDISEQRMSQEALRNSEKRNRKFIEELGDNFMAFRQTKEGILLYVSPGMKSIFGITAKDATGKRWQDIIEWTPESLITGNNKTRNILENKKSKQIELSFIHPDNTLRTITADGHRVNDRNGNLEYIEGILEDITERKNTEEQIINQSRILKAVLDNIQAGVFMVEAPSGKPILTNKKAEEFLGRGISPEANGNALNKIYQAYKYGTDNLYPPEEMPIVAGLRGEHKTINDMEIRKPDNTKILLEVKGSPILDNEKNITASVVVFQDITERKKMENDLEKHTEKLEELVEDRTATLREVNELLKCEIDMREQAEKQWKILMQSINTGVLVHNHDTTIITHNTEAENLLGQNREQLLGRNASDDVWHFLREDGTVMPAHEFPVNQVIESKSPLRNHIAAIYGKNKKIKKWVLVNANPMLNPDGELKQIIVSFTDITKLKHAEKRAMEAEKIRDLAMEVSGIGIYEIDMASGKQEWSENIYKIYGLQQDNFDLELDQFFELIHPEDKEELKEKWKTAITSDDKSWNAEYRIIRPDHRIIWIRDYGHIFRNRHKKPLTILGTIVDITKNKETEEQIKNLLRDKDLLLREVHHRIKNNMNTIASLLSLQADTIEDGPSSTALLDAQNRVISMMRIYEILYKSGDYIHIDIRQYLTNLIEKIQESYNTNPGSITINTDIEDIQMKTELSFPLGIVINELITNSLKYAFPDNRSGTITVNLLLQDTSTALLLVSDNGIGIPESIEIKQSPGFGLFLVDSLVNQLEGTITISGTNGTVYRIIFPI